MASGGVMVSPAGSSARGLKRPSSGGTPAKSSPATPAPLAPCNFKTPIKIRAILEAPGPTDAAIVLGTAKLELVGNPEAEACTFQVVAALRIGAYHAGIVVHDLRTDDIVARSFRSPLATAISHLVLMGAIGVAPNSMSWHHNDAGLPLLTIDFRVLLKWRFDDTTKQHLLDGMPEMAQLMEHLFGSTTDTSRDAEPVAQLDMSLVDFYERLRPPAGAPTCDDIHGVRTKLYHYQRQAVAWLLDRESHRAQPLAAEAQPLSVKGYEVLQHPIEGAIGFTFRMVNTTVGHNRTMECIQVTNITHPACIAQPGDIVTAVNGLVCIPNVFSGRRERNAHAANARVVSCEQLRQTLLQHTGVSIRFLRRTAVAEALEDNVQILNIQALRQSMCFNAVKTYTSLMPTVAPRADDVLHPGWKAVSAMDGTPLHWNALTGGISDTPVLVPPVDGGILAEEMGLGKTLEILALIHANQLTPAVMPVGTTLVGCSASCITAAEKELPTEHIDNALRIRARCTLIVTPPALLSQWESEARKHCPDIRVVMYQGMERKDELAPTLLEMVLADIVLVSFDVLDRELDFCGWGGGGSELGVSNAAAPYTLRGEKPYPVPVSQLYKLRFWRIVLDEAQMVGSVGSRVALMASRLSSVHRWCVTGTPLGPDGMHDFRGMFTFLRQLPFSVNDWWERLFKSWIARHQVDAIVRVVRPLFWRHSKAHVAHEVAIPACRAEWARLRLSAIEQEYYSRLLQMYRDKAQGQTDPSNPDMMAAVLHLRQAVCHPVLAAGSAHAADGPTAGLTSKQVTLSDVFDRLLIGDTNTLQELQRQRCAALNDLARLDEVAGNLAAARDRLLQSWETSQAVVIERVRYHDEAAVMRAWKLIEFRAVRALQRIATALGDMEEAKHFAELERSVVVAEYAQNHAAALQGSRDTIQWHREILMQPVSELFFAEESADPRVVELLAEYQARARQNMESKDIDDSVDPDARQRVVTPELAERARVERSRIQTLATIAHEYVQRDDLRQDVNVFQTFQATLTKAVMDRKAVLLQEFRQQAVEYDTEGTIPRARIPPRLAFDQMCTRLQKALHKQEHKVTQLEDAHPVREWRWVLPHPSVCMPEQLANAAADLKNAMFLCEEIAQELLDYGLVEQWKTRVADAARELSNAAVERAEVASKDTLLRQLDTCELKLAKQHRRIKYLEYIRQRRDKDDGAECLVCRQENVLPVFTPCCLQILCSECVALLFHGAPATAPCPQCREPMRKGALLEVDPASGGAEIDSETAAADAVIPMIGSGQFGTKIEALVRRLLRLRAHAPQDKVLVFSQWPRMLELAMTALTANGFKYVTLNGSLRLRKAAVARFSTDPNITVFLLNASNHASGLTLVAANHVFLMEPSLDATMEAQAIARVHRLGQTKPCFVTHFLVKDTVEEAVLHVQQTKAASHTTDDSLLSQQPRWEAEDAGAGVVTELGLVVS